MTTLARFTGVAFALSGSNIVAAPLAAVTVRREDTGALASLFSDRDGTLGLTNPMTADAFGRFAFHAAALVQGYRITVTEAASPGTEYTYRYVPMGTLSEVDNPMTTLGDLIRAASGGSLTRLGVGTDGYPLVPTSGGVAPMAYLPPALGFNLVGGYLDWSVVGSPTSTLSVAIKTWSGNDPSATEPVFIPFRSATATNGGITYRKITAATSITINDTALLGTVSGVAFRLWCVAFDDGGTIRLALVNCLATPTTAPQIFPLAAWGIASSTLEDNASDSAHVFYSSGAAVTLKPYAVLGYGEWGESVSSPTTLGLPNAGNWNSNPTRVQLFGPGVLLPGAELQQVTDLETTEVSTTGTTFVTTGLSLTITPSSPANLIRIEATTSGRVTSTSNQAGSTGKFQIARGSATGTTLASVEFFAGHSGAASIAWTTGATAHLRAQDVNQPGATTYVMAMKADTSGDTIRAQAQSLTNSGIMTAREIMT